MWVSSNTCEGSLNISGSRKKITHISCPAGKEPVVELTIFRIFLACTKVLFCLCVESFFSETCFWFHKYLKIRNLRLEVYRYPPPPKKEVTKNTEDYLFFVWGRMACLQAFSRPGKNRILTKLRQRRMNSRGRSPPSHRGPFSKPFTWLGDLSREKLSSLKLT